MISPYFIGIFVFFHYLAVITKTQIIMKNKNLNTSEKLYVLTCFTHYKELAFTVLFRTRERAEKEMSKEMNGLLRVLYEEGLTDADIRI